MRQYIDMDTESDPQIICWECNHGADKHNGEWKQCRVKGCKCRLPDYTPLMPSLYDAIVCIQRSPQWLTKH